MTVKIEESWQKVLQEEFEKPYFKNLVAFVKDEYATKKVYPPGNEIFNAFRMCPFDEVKVVILGQDPYHGPNQANGFAFSVRDEVRVPPSLVNVFKEIKSDLGKDLPPTGNLERWAKQGVLLLNATLTVQAGNAGSHQRKGWEQFTDAVVQQVNQHREHVVFMLWGAYAQKKGAYINEQKHLVLQAAHPSPFAADRGFFGCRHFSKANAYLQAKGKEPIVW